MATTDDDIDSEAKATAKWLDGQVEEGNIKFDVVQRRMSFPAMLAELIDSHMKRFRSRKTFPDAVHAYVERLASKDGIQAERAGQALRQAWFPLARRRITVTTAEEQKPDRS